MESTAHAQELHHLLASYLVNTRCGIDHGALLTSLADPLAKLSAAFGPMNPRQSGALGAFLAQAIHSTHTCLKSDPATPGS